MARPVDLHDRAELADLVARYAVIVDQRDFDRFDDVFTAEARYEATSHLVGQQLISVTDDAEIDTVTYCEAHHLRIDGDERINHVMHIRYHDRFVPTSDGWRIAYRRLEVPWSADYPV